jgi:hypothetical protein
MRRPLGGYTLIEVIIFLAVSTAILAMSIVVVRGQEAHAEFSTSANEVNSKFLQWIDQVDNGYSGSTAANQLASSNYNCDLSQYGDGVARPVLTYPTFGPANGRGKNADCIFLGKAIQVNADDTYSNQITVYNILGRRIDETGDNVFNIPDANPVAASFPQTGLGDRIDLTETYKIPNGARVLSVANTNKNDQNICGVNPTGTSQIGGFYTNFNLPKVNSANGSLSIIAIQYPLCYGSPASSYLPESAQVLDCLRLVSPCAAPCSGLDCNKKTAGLWYMTQWMICLGSSRNGETALLTINSGVKNGAGVGAGTTLEFKPCS